MPELPSNPSYSKFSILVAAAADIAIDLLLPTVVYFLLSPTRLSAIVAPHHRRLFRGSESRCGSSCQRKMQPCTADKLLQDFPARRRHRSPGNYCHVGRTCRRLFRYGSYCRWLSSSCARQGHATHTQPSQVGWLRVTRSAGTCRYHHSHVHQQFTTPAPHPS